MRELLVRLRPVDAAQWIFVGFLGLLLGGGVLAGSGHPATLLVPALAVVGAVLVLTRWQWLYYLLLATLPFSHEIKLPGGLSMDVPSEPLLLALMGCVPLALVLGPGGPAQLRRREWQHPLLLLPAVMLAWAAFDVLFSVDALKSTKYVLAKCWYLVPCLLGTLVLVRRPTDFWRLAGCYAASTAVALLWILPRHATGGFSFGKVGWAIQPFYLNHVIYATVLALLLPLVAGLVARAATPRARWAWLAVGALLLFGLLTSYTRASWLALPVAGLYYLVLRLRLTWLVLAGLILAGLYTTTYFSSDARFMRYAPDFEHVVWHGGHFDQHLASTYKLQDVSGMERVYRWVAAARMVADKPLTGTGPATFYPAYKRYTVKSFRTYVSDNPEHSTTHNYFLLQLAEQGLPGFLLFFALVATLLLTAERLYHASTDRPEVRRLVLACSLSLVIILFHLFLNELLEVDKIGTIFFIELALLIRCGTWLRNEEPSREPAASYQSAAGG